MLCLKSKQKPSLEASLETLFQSSETYAEKHSVLLFKKRNYLDSLHVIALNQVTHTHSHAHTSNWRFIFLKAFVDLYVSFLSF